MSIWHALHFNTIAKEIREQFPLDSDNEDIERPTRNGAAEHEWTPCADAAPHSQHAWQDEFDGYVGTVWCPGKSAAATRALRKAELLAERTALTRLALSFAHRFNDKNIPFFDPLRFLDACSPNTDLYPLSEMWEE